MSVYLVQRYIQAVEKVKHFGGSSNEGSLEMEFRTLLNEYCKPKGFILVPKISIKTSDGKTIIPDGVIKDALRLDWGYWESKDEKDDLDEEITAKFRKGYPKDNILFEDKITAVLYQGGSEFGRAAMDDPAALDKLLTQFTNYERPEVHNFRVAIDKFKQDLPTVVETLRDIIEAQAATNKKFRESRETFWELCKQVINPDISRDDIREMVIQHILTEDIFNTIFDETQFHRENNIAKELQKVCDTFFTGETKRNTLGTIQHYYQVINANAAGIADHHEKQKFLKVIYETFYKAYNPKAADRLGIVYTPGEIVNFMIESTDYLLHKHFNRSLGDKNVEILDPATGTGTFICDIIDYLPIHQLEYKYKNEIHANEVAILPYYIANLNIEYTYKQKTGQYKEFESICFVDTLDNMGFAYHGKQEGMFGLAAENAERIKRQNERKISVIIGNPPYNANQMNENENNKNRPYDEIDKRIKDTYIKHSTAQKTKLYDMYARFLRWASDRLDKDGVIAFVSNNSFINSRTFDGFRKCVNDEFNHVYIINLKGDARTSGEQRRKEKGNVFNDQIRVGVAVYFFVKSEKDTDERCRIWYNEIRDYAESEDKLSYLSENRVKTLKFTEIKPDAKNNWINLADNDFETLVPLADKDTKLAKNKEAEQSVFKSFSLGIATNRDEWVYDYDDATLSKKIKYFTDIYGKEKVRWQKSDKKAKINNFVDRTIKWTSELEDHLRRMTTLIYNKKNIRKGVYRPFVKMHLYFDRVIIHRPYQNETYFKIGDNNVINKLICVNANGAIFNTLATNVVANNHFNGDSQCLPLYRYDEHGNRIDNITDWGLAQFREHYDNLTPALSLKRRGSKITKEDIFHYVYGVLHNPAYRKKYELNLKREFPRIPFYDDFWKWAKWGKELMELHIGYETAKPFKLRRSADVPVRSPKDAGRMPVLRPKAKLKADKANGHIILDEETTLMGVPPEAWEYKLGNRSALEWILDQYKEKTPKDPTIREKFNTYKFADYKEHVIDLLQRVTTVSVRTMEIVKEMEDSTS